MLFQKGCEIIGVELIAPVGKLPVLIVEDLNELFADRPLGSGIRSYFSPERRNRIIALKGLIVPALNGRDAKGDPGILPRWMWVASGSQGFELLFEIPPLGRPRKERADDGKTKM
jgi:hypothetical protein